MRNIKVFRDGLLPLEPVTQHPSRQVGIGAGVIGSYPVRDGL
ncbi:MAG: hypothetical protein QME51_00925 [Planctomycetota bacterium]|nr:hypothetical protein [Planctomycetota bacterium]MDI6786921.1 hypothetical protein [Planctomycetota bacterium]